MNMLEDIGRKVVLDHIRKKRQKALENVIKAMETKVMYGPFNEQQASMIFQNIVAHVFGEKFRNTVKVVTLNTGKMILDIDCTLRRHVDAK